MGTAIAEVPGLFLVHGFLSEEEHDEILTRVERDILRVDEEQQGRNQAMLFGNLPSWVDVLAARLLQHPDSLFASPEIRQRDPLFDQMIVNEYWPGDGIVDHVDLVKFEDGIAGISFGSTCIMTFRRCASTSSGAMATAEAYSTAPEPEQQEVHEEVVPPFVEVLLQPGDLICLSGEARWAWTHGIPARTEDVWQGETLRRRRRVSITLRRLIQGAS